MCQRRGVAPATGAGTEFKEGVARRWMSRLAVLDMVMRDALRFRPILGLCVEAYQSP